MSESGRSSTAKKNPRRRRWLWFSLLAIVILVAVAAALVLPRLDGEPTASAEDDAPGASNYADVVVTDLRQEEEFNGELESIKGTGTTVPAAQIALAFDTPGVVAELPVQVGQVVQAGDLLARVDVTALAAQDQLAVAQAQLEVANEIAQLEEDVSAAEEQVALAEAGLLALTSGPNEPELEIGRRQIAQARNNLWAAQAQRDAVCGQADLGYADQVHCDSAEASVGSAHEAVRIAEQQLLQLEAGPSEAEVSQAQAQLRMAQAQLTETQAALESALSGLADHRKEGTPTVVTPTTQAQFTLQQTRLNQQAHLDGAVITASISGTIMSIDGQLGEQAGTAPFVSMADLSQPVLEVDMEETNLDKVAVGTEVEARLSALPDEPFSGTVMQIDPQLNTAGAHQSFLRVLIRLENPQDRVLPAGLSASVNLIGASNRIVRLFLPPADEGMLAVGDRVMVELPDSSTVPGTVVFVPQVPTASASGQASFHILVELADEDEIDAAKASTLADLPDETSVDVIFVSDAVTDVMAVPVTSLVALLEGGYAVEKKTSLGRVQLIPVEVGFFGSNNMIAITSDALQPGDQVVVP